MGRIIVNDDTGEKTGSLNMGDRIVRAKSIEHLNEYEIWTIKHFYKGNVDEIRKLLQDLSQNERAFLFSVVTYIGYNDCCIKYDDGKTMDASDLARITKMGKSLLYSVIESLRQKDIIYKGKNSGGMQYFVNPWLFSKGSKINSVLRTMFKNYKIKVMENKTWGSIKE